MMMTSRSKAYNILSFPKFHNVQLNYVVVGIYTGLGLLPKVSSSELFKLVRSLDVLVVGREGQLNLTICGECRPV